MKISIEWKGQTLTFEGHHEPGEPSRYYYDGGHGYPGYPDQFEWTEIYWNGIDVTDLMGECDKYYEEWDELILKELS